MIAHEEARMIAKRYLDDLQKEIGDPLQLAKIQEESFGWVFFIRPKSFWRRVL